MIWKFNDAPEAFRKLSTLPPGSEQFLIFVPPLYAKDDFVLMMFEKFRLLDFDYGKYGAKIYIATAE
jgi:hypothetical protein